MEMGNTVHERTSLYTCHVRVPTVFHVQYKNSYDPSYLRVNLNIKL